MVFSLWLLSGAYLYLSPNLPNVEKLKDVKLQTPMQILTQEGELIGQFGEQKRKPLNYEEIYIFLYLEKKRYRRIDKTIKN